jgi:hypothetical protein
MKTLIIWELKRKELCLQIYDEEASKVINDFTEKYRGDDLFYAVDTYLSNEETSLLTERRKLYGISSCGSDHLLHEVFPVGECMTSVIPEITFDRVLFLPGSD